MWQGTRSRPGYAQLPGMFCLVVLVFFPEHAVLTLSASLPAHTLLRVVKRHVASSLSLVLWALTSADEILFLSTTTLSYQGY